MDAPIKLLKSKDCNKHNQPIILYDPDPKKGGYCFTCIQEKTGMISAESYIQKLNVIINQADEQCDKDIQLLQNWHLSITNYKSSLTQSLDKILKVIVAKIEIREKFRQKLKQLSQYSEDEQKIIDDLQLECQNQQKESELVQQQVRKQLQNFQIKYFNTVDQLVSSFSEEQKIIIQEASQVQRKFQYELIKESCMEENKRCFAFAFNRNNSILLVARIKEIIIYEFNQGFIEKELQRLTNHSDSVTCLEFMTKSNSFVSGDFDSLIIIWEYDYGENKYFAKQVLEGHKYRVNCILKSRNDDLLITSDPEQIKFWSIINNIWSCRQTIQTGVDAMSLNELEDKLISSYSLNKLISVIKKGHDNQWSIVQQINVSSGSLKLCITIEDQFAFKPKGDYLEVYDYNQITQKFEIINYIKFQQQENDRLFFPCQYIQQIRMLSFRYGPNVNLFKVNQEGNYQLIQQIQFKNDMLFGRLTDDGQYLITWDEESSQIQVRALRDQF